MRDSYTIKYAKLSAKFSINNAGLPCNIFNSHQSKCSLEQAFFYLAKKTLKDKKLKEKAQNSSTKLKVSANLVKINAENKANKSKNEGQF